MRMLRSVLSFAAFAVIIAFAIGYIGALGVRIGEPPDRTRLSMAVTNINGLVVGSNVLLRGIAVGKVTAIRPAADGATIDFYVNAVHRVPVDSMVRLDNLSALGEAYIGLFPQTGAGPMLADGQRVRTESIRQPLSIADLAISVGRLLRQADPEQLARIVAEADAALPDPGSVLPNLARTGTLLRAEAAGMNGRGKELLDNLQTLLRNAGVAGPALAGLAPELHRLGPNMQGIFANAMNLVLAGSPENLERFQAYLGRLQNFFDTRSPDIKVLAETLMPNARNMNAALMHFDTGRVLDNMLAGVPADGTINLRLTVTPPG